MFPSLHPSTPSTLHPGFVAHLRGVQKLAATWGAFAALDACGRVAAWGAPNYGGRVADAAGEGAAKAAGRTGTARGHAGLRGVFVDA